MSFAKITWQSHSQQQEEQMDFQQYYDTRKKLVNNFLEKRMEKRGISNVDDAMKYSLLAGGKRLRPILLKRGRPYVFIWGLHCTV